MIVVWHVLTVLITSRRLKGTARNQAAGLESIDPIDTLTPDLAFGNVQVLRKERNLKKQALRWETLGISRLRYLPLKCGSFSFPRVYSRTWLYNINN